MAKPEKYTKILHNKRQKTTKSNTKKIIDFKLLNDTFGGLETISSQPSYNRSTNNKRNAIVHQLRSIRKNNIMITRGKFRLYLSSWRRLNGSTFIDDNVINLYIRLMLDNVQQQQQQTQNQYYQYTTFFFSYLSKNMPEKRLKKMAWQGSISTYDMIFVPINKDRHWMLITIEPKRKRLRYFDSMKPKKNSEPLYKLCKIVKFIQLIDGKCDVNEWKRVVVNEIPQQRNGYDCGVFLMEYVRQLLEGRDLPNFSNEENEMKEIRRRMLVELRLWKKINRNENGMLRKINLELNKLKALFMDNKIY